jgi:hypothetical protein
MRNFPQQDLPESKKDIKWCGLHLDYAQDILRGSDWRRTEMDDLYRSYNGDKTPKSVLYLTKTYGKDNRAKYISYRAHNTKLKLMIGEFLTRPLNATVETINRDAVTDKMRQMDFYFGAMEAKKELEELKTKAGVDVMEGASIPEDENDPAFLQMAPKDKEESIMQIILNEQIPSLDLKHKFADNVLDLSITAMCFGKVERDEEGETRYIPIDPRDAVYEEIKGDPFLEKSPILGSRQWLAIHDVMKRYRLSPEQVETLKQVSKNAKEYYNTSNGSIRPNPSGGVMIEVLHVEWKSLTPIYYQKFPKTASQLAIDSSEEFIIRELDAEKYEANKNWYDSQVKKGVFKIEVKYYEEMWEATRLGGLKELDVNCRKANFQMRSVDDPTRILAGSYIGYLCGTVDGKRISLYAEMENWSNMFDITMYQILKDINKHKGTVLGFNTAALGRKSSVKQINYDIVNDGFVTYDTSATGNFHGRDVSLQNILQTYDLGLSNSFGSLIQFKNDILQMMDRMTGINENREGQIMASTTATNANNAIMASRTITEPFNYGVHLYISKVLRRIVESTKITWAFFKIEKGEQILGIDKFRWMQVTQELGFKDYGVHLQDGSKYGEVRQFMTQMMQASLNAREIRPEDALKFMLSESFADQKAVLEDGWKKVKEFETQKQQEQLQAQQQMSQQQQDFQLQLAKENREDLQSHDIDKIDRQGEWDLRIKGEEAQNKIIQDKFKFDNESTMNENI